MSPKLKGILFESRFLQITLSTNGRIYEEIFIPVGQLQFSVSDPALVVTLTVPYTLDKYADVSLKEGIRRHQAGEDGDQYSYLVGLDISLTTGTVNEVFFSQDKDATWLDRATDKPLENLTCKVKFI